MSSTEKTSITAVILAAGAGSRLGELGKRYSKPMVPILERPLIAWVIERLQKAGVDRLVVVGHPNNAALDRFLAQHHPDAAIVHQAQRRGIADALRCALPLLADEPGYLACACDSLFPVADLRRLIALGVASKGAACVGVLEMGREATATRSAVRLQGERVLEIIEKPPPGTAASGLVAMPLYWLPDAMASCLSNDDASGETYVSTALTRFIQLGGSVHPSTVSQRLEVTTAADVEVMAQVLRLDQTD